MWVGGTEQNIASAFESALRDEAVLLFDEADSFLQRSRRRAAILGLSPERETGLGPATLGLGSRCSTN